jgi:hypothetical protein
LEDVSWLLLPVLGVPPVPPDPEVPVLPDPVLPDVPAPLFGVVSLVAPVPPVLPVPVLSLTDVVLVLSEVEELFSVELLPQEQMAKAIIAVITFCFIVYDLKSLPFLLGVRLQKICHDKLQHQRISYSVVRSFLSLTSCI